MANYSYLYLREPPDEARVDADLRRIVSEKFGDRLTVRKVDLGVWTCEIPGTAGTSGMLQAPGENVGFLVELDFDEFADAVLELELESGTTIAFRHPLERFESWLQACIAERLARLYGVEQYFDSIDEYRSPDHPQHKDYPSYQQYCRAQLAGLNEPDLSAVLERYQKATPEGWW